MSGAKNSSHGPGGGAIFNRRAKFDYTTGDELKVGLELSGKKVRAARDGRVQLKGAFVTTRGGQLWLNNASFSVRLNEKNSPSTTVDTSPVRLLATRKQILSLISEKDKKGVTIVPLRLLTKGKWIKLVIALGKGKKSYDKREVIKKRDLEREERRENQR